MDILVRGLIEMITTSISYKVTTTFYADDFTTINADAKGITHSIELIELIYAYCTKWRLTLNCNKRKTEALVMYCKPSDEKHQQ